MGLYVLLSLLALIGLLVALHAGQSAEAVAQQTQEVQHRLRVIREELQTGEDPQIVITSWQTTFHRDSQRLWLVDKECKALTIAEDELPSEITLQSVVQSAIRFGESSKRIRLGVGSGDMLAFGLDASADADNVRAPSDSPFSK